MRDEKQRRAGLVTYGYGGGFVYDDHVAVHVHDGDGLRCDGHLVSVTVTVTPSHSRQPLLSHTRTHVTQHAQDGVRWAGPWLASC